MPKSTNWAPVVCTATALAVLALSWTSLYPYSPTPDDESFYFDAAWRLLHPPYPSLGPSFPFHHYLRWTALIAPAAAFALLGANDFSYTLVPLLGHLACAGALFLLFRCGGASRLACLWAALAGMIPSLMVWRYLSEPWVVAWSLLSLALVARCPRRLSAAFAAGLAYGLAINASLVAVFSAFCPMLLALLSPHARGESAPHRRMLQSVCFVLGIALCLGVIQSIEAFFFGEFFLQLTLIRNWHLKSLQDELTLSQFLFDWNEPSRFVFGFTLQLVREPLFLLAAALLVIQFRLQRSARPYGVTIAAVAAASLLSLELLAPLAVSKFYTRFAALPSTLIIAAACALVPDCLRSGAFLRRAIALLIAMLVITSYATQVISAAPASCARPYAPVLELVARDARSRNAQQPRLTHFIIDLHGGVPGFNHLPHVLGVYTRFTLEPLTALETWPRTPRFRRERYYVLTAPGSSPSLPPKGRLIELPYPDECAAPRARAFRWVKGF